MHPNWPVGVAVPSRDGLRALVHLDWLFADRSQAPDWVLSPTQSTLTAFQAPGATAIAEGLGDADRRLGLILEAVVDAYAADPSEAVTLLSYDQGDVIFSDAWPLPPDVARRLDFVLLEDARLVTRREPHRGSRRLRRSAADSHPVPARALDGTGLSGYSNSVVAEAECVGVLGNGHVEAPSGA